MPDVCGKPWVDKGNPLCWHECWRPAGHEGAHICTCEDMKVEEDAS